MIKKKKRKVVFTIKRKKKGGKYILFIAIILVIALASTYFYQESEKGKKAAIIAEEEKNKKINDEEKNKEKDEKEEKNNEEKEKQNREQEEKEKKEQEEKEKKENESKVAESAENNNQTGSAESNTNASNGEEVAAVVGPEQNPAVVVPMETDVPTGAVEQAPVTPVEAPTLIVSTNPYDQAYNAEGLLKEINYKQSDDNQIYMNPVSFFDKVLTLPEIIELTDKENRKDIEGLGIEYEENKIQITIEKPIPFGDGSYIIGEFGYYVNENDEIDKYDNADIKFLDSNLHFFAFLTYEENRRTHEETYKSLGRNYTHESGRCEVSYYDSTTYQITHTCYPKSGIVKFPGDGTYSIE